MTPDTAAVRAYLLALQEKICSTLEATDGGASFRRDAWQRPGGGGGQSRVLKDGRLLEQGGVGFSHVTGESLPPSATLARPDLAGASFEALGVSLVLHPKNPYVPTTHMNVRFFTASRAGVPAAWWFGGGFDLTPTYAFDEDVRHWHRTAEQACAPFGKELYPRLKAWCDRYFYLPHRGETRGVGGVFFDDYSEGGFDQSFALQRAIGDAFLGAYLPIVARRRDTAFGAHQRDFQLYRRGRYVEFNLVFDRGTQFGLQSGGRTESILMSLPPLARWEYGFEPEPNSAEAELAAKYLKPRDWLGEPKS